MKLNIYDRKKVVKTYTADSYDLMFGLCEDVANAINLDSIKTGSDTELIQAVAKLIVGSMDTVKELLKDIFDGITDNEIKHTKVKEIINVFVEVVKYTITQINIGVDPKN